MKEYDRTWLYGVYATTDELRVLRETNGLYRPSNVIVALCRRCSSVYGTRGRKTEGAKVTASGKGFSKKTEDRYRRFEADVFVPSKNTPLPFFFVCVRVAKLLSIGAFHRARASSNRWPSLSPSPAPCARSKGVKCKHCSYTYRLLLTIKRFNVHVLSYKSE